LLPIPLYIVESLKITESSKDFQGTKIAFYTKHINIRYYHRGEITLHVVSTNEQPINVLTKPLYKAKLDQNHKFIMCQIGTTNAKMEFKILAIVCLVKASAGLSPLIGVDY